MDKQQTVVLIYFVIGLIAAALQVVGLYRRRKQVIVTPRLIEKLLLWTALWPGLVIFSFSDFMVKKGDEPWFTIGKGK